MASFSNYTENKVLDHVLGVQSFTAPTTVYVALFNNTSTNMAANLEANIITDELTAASYARKAVTFSAATGGASSNSADVQFDEALQSWGSVDGVAIVDTASGPANVLAWGIPTLIKSIDVGDIYQVQATKLNVSLD